MRETFKRICIATIVILTCCLLTTLNACKKQVQKPEIQALQRTIRSFIGKTPNELYAKVGTPAKYDAMVDDKTNIIGARITYNYVYNFKESTYDCQIYFFTNKEQDRIVSVAYSSDKCHYIFR